jgi:VanZ family protein
VKWSALSLWLIAWAIGTIYAVTDEIHQYFVPERACAVTDMLIDSAGVVVGVGIMMLIAYNKRVTSSKQ